MDENENLIEQLLLLEMLEDELNETSKKEVEGGE